MMQTISGQYVWPDSAQAVTATASVQGEVLSITDDTGRLLHQSHKDQVTFASVIPGLPVEAILPDQARFIPDDPRWRWPQLSRSQRLPEFLERHWLSVIIALILVPGFVWVMIKHIIPAASAPLAYLIPDAVVSELSEQTLRLLDETQLSPSSLTTAEQQVIRQQWHLNLQHLGLQPPGQQHTELPSPAEAKEKYRLLFRSFSAGPNAFALPDGSVIVTDEIVSLTHDKPELLHAILLHEVGHVEHNHGMEMLAQSIATSLLFAMMFGDIEGSGELLLGVGTVLLQSAFSRDMEREADRFASNALQKLKQSPLLFAEALQRLQQAHAQKADEPHDTQPWFDYFSSHPNTAERIQQVQQAP